MLEWGTLGHSSVVQGLKLNNDMVFMIVDGLDIKANNGQDKNLRGDRQRRKMAKMTRLDSE